MQKALSCVKRFVHCRTGSLEIDSWMENASLIVHCRTGSLEIQEKKIMAKKKVHCRTGSLESLGIVGSTL